MVTDTLVDGNISDISRGRFEGEEFCETCEAGGAVGIPGVTMPPGSNVAEMEEEIKLKWSDKI